MKLDPVLRKASKTARGGNYEKAVQILEPEEYRYRGSFYYSYLIGVCSLFLGNWTRALDNFHHAHGIKARNPEPLLGMAVLFFRRGEISKTVDIYLDVQELDKKNRIAKKGLAMIRKYAGSDALTLINDTGKLKSLYPPIPWAGFNISSVLAGMAIIFSLLILGFGIFIKFDVIQNPFGKKAERGNRIAYTLSPDDRSQPLQSDGSFRFNLSKTDVLRAYEKALSYFTSHRDEKARIDLNRILESNASENIKNKSRILLAYMEAEKPGFDTFNKNDNVLYSEVIQEPFLYRGVHVIWRGKAANVSTIQNETSFLLLIGYDDDKTIEGTVNVVFSSAISINTERPVEVLGRISQTGNHEIMLDGIAFHQSGSLIFK